MRIRIPGRDDAHALARLSAQLGYPATAEEVESQLSHLLGAPDHLVLVADAGDGTMAGWIHAFISRRLFMLPFAELGGLIVDEPFRRAGLAGRLLGEVEGWAAADGCTMFRIRSNVTRSAAHHFYLHNGYGRDKTQFNFTKVIESCRAP